MTLSLRTEVAKSLAAAGELAVTTDLEADTSIPRASKKRIVRLVARATTSVVWNVRSAMCLALLLSMRLARWRGVAGGGFGNR